MYTEQEFKYLREHEISPEWEKMNQELREAHLRDALKGFRKITHEGRKDILDTYTASAIVQILDAINVERKQKFLSMPLCKMVDVTWRIINKIEN